MKELKWGILSTATIAAQQMIPAIKACGNAVIAGVASRDLRKAQAFAATHGIKKAYGSYDALLADPEIDAIYNPLPSGMHTLWNLACAKANKPVLCEKPFAVRAEDAAAVFDACDKAGVVVMEASMFRYHPLTHEVFNLVTSGAIGQIRSIHSTFHTILPVTDIRFMPAMGGGALWDLGYYCVAFSNLIAQGPAIKARALGVWAVEGDVDTTIASSLLYPNGTVGSFTCSMTTPFECCYDIAGSDGRIRVDRGAMIAWPGESFIIRLWQADQYREIAIEPANHYALMVKNFADAVRGLCPLRVTREETIATIATLEQLRKEAA